MNQPACPMDPEAFREQHKLRLSWMPWLYFVLKERHREWVQAWQREEQDRLMALETIPGASASARTCGSRRTRSSGRG